MSDPEIKDPADELEIPDLEQEQEAEKPAEPEQPAEPAPEIEEVAITFGDEPVEQPESERAPDWVRELRKTNREQARRIREFEQRELQQSTVKAQPAAPALGAKPTLEACDFDADKFEAELDAWKERKRAIDAEEQRKQDALKAEQEQWQGRLKAYAERKTALKVPDFEDAEAASLTTLNVNQQGIILHGLDDPAAFVYAIGKSPAKLKELAAIADPVKFAVAAAKLETQMKTTTMTKAKAPPPPESVVKGSAPTRADATLDRLEAEAERTGDRSKIYAYKQQLRAKA